MVDVNESANQLRSVVERIENLESEKKTVSEEIRMVYDEAKGNGFNVKAIREIIKLRRQDKAERQEKEAIVDLYKTALGIE